MLVPLPEPMTIGALFRQFSLAQGEIIFPDTIVSAFTSSSKDVKEGSLFIACRGIGIDGHKYIDEAFDAGASAVVVGDISKLKNRAGFEVSNARVLLSRLSAFAFQQPTKAMRVIGVVGTNGKTTSSWMIYHALRALGEKCVRIGTLGYEISGGPASKDTLTTPSAEDLNNILSMARDQGCTSAVLEVSSHALHQHRVDDISLDAAAFTNITQDHLDYHRTFEEYFKAKKRIFDLLRVSKKPKKVFCTNLNTPEGLKIYNEYAASFDVNASFGYEKNAPVQIVEVVQGRTSSKVTLVVSGETTCFETCFLGRHNAENLALTMGILHGLEYPIDKVSEVLAKIPPVPGRLEPFECNGIATFVDYAHSPDALERVMICLKETSHKKLVLVFGCGGDRDWRKRSVMGNIAARLADYVVVTSDNPRTEDPDKIIADILDSDLRVGSNCEVVPDRAKAIEAALSKAVEGDLVLIAGKGHEDYQIIGNQKHHFSDQEEIRKFFNCSQ